MSTLAEPEATTWTCRASFCDEALDTPEGRFDGWCNGCAQRWWRAGKPEDGPPPPIHPQPPGRGNPGTKPETRARLERFAQLRALGLTIAQCAAIMDVTESTAGHLNGMLLRQQREQAHGEADERALNAIVDWPVPSPPRPAAVRWSDRSACYGHHELMFAPEGRSAETTAEREIREAKAKSLCAACPVRAECLQYAFGRKQDTGVWGGLGEDERGRERQRWLRARRAVA